MPKLKKSAERSRSMWAKEDHATLEAATDNEQEFALHLGTDLNQHNFAKTERLLVSYDVCDGEGYPGHLMQLAFLLAQEWTDQMGQRVVCCLELGMGAPPMGLYRPMRRGHFNYREPEPLDIGIEPGTWVSIVQPTRFLPINCPFCKFFVAATHYCVMPLEGSRLVVPSCSQHLAIPGKRTLL